MSGVPAPEEAAPDMSAYHRPTAPRGVAREMYQLEKSADLPSTPALRGVQEGKDAVIVSKNVNKLKRQDVVGQSFSSEIKYVGMKTFYLINQIWIDSEYVEGQQTVTIKYGSDAYFRLLDEVPELGKYFSLGENLIVCWDEDLCLKIGEHGISKADDRELLEVLQKL